MLPRCLSQIGDATSVGFRRPSEQSCSSSRRQVSAQVAADAQQKKKNFQEATSAHKHLSDLQVFVLPRSGGEFKHLSRCIRNLTGGLLLLHLVMVKNSPPDPRMWQRCRRRRGKEGRVEVMERKAGCWADVSS